MSTPLILTDLDALTEGMLSLTIRAQGRSQQVHTSRQGFRVWRDRFHRAMGVIVQDEVGEEQTLWVLSPEVWERVLWLTEVQGVVASAKTQTPILA